MSFTLHSILRKRFREQIQQVKNYDTQYDNQADFTPPRDKLWIRWTVRIADSRQIDICSNPRTRTTGIAIAQIFGLLSKGDKDVLIAADFVKSKFRLSTIDGVVYEEPTITTVGVREGRWQVNVTCPFTYDEVVTGE